MSSEVLKVIPYDLSAEQMVLGALMLSGVNPKTDAIFSMLKPESFYTLAHQHIYAEMRSLAQASKPIDI